MTQAWLRDSADTVRWGIEHALEAIARIDADAVRNRTCGFTALAWLALPLASFGHEAPAEPVDYFRYAIGALIVVQTILIVMLIVQNRRHLRAKTDAQKQYAEITHAARLALVGEITASVAHEVTQPLSAILSNVETAELLLRKANPDLPSILEILADVRQDDLRAHSIVQRLRTLLRKRELQFEHVDINALTSNVLALILPDAVRRNVVIRTALEPGLPRVPADPVHLQQVLLNLIINAMDAMKETAVTNRWLDVRTERQGDEFVQVVILDTGHGIAPERTDRVFESFFTTKSDGMGLGLSIVRSIVKMHGGAIVAENRESGGAAFRFTVPVRNADVATSDDTTRRPQY